MAIFDGEDKRIWEGLIRLAKNGVFRARDIAQRFGMSPERVKDVRRRGVYALFELGFSNKEVVEHTGLPMEQVSVYRGHETKRRRNKER